MGLVPSALPTYFCAWGSKTGGADQKDGFWWVLVDFTCFEGPVPPASRSNDVWIEGL